MNDVTFNPMGNATVVASPQPISNGAAQSDQARAVAEVQAAMVVAKANPRNPVMAMDRILNACQRPSLANAAVYTYARAGSDITGPSIRLAETIAQAWGNLAFGIRELSQIKGESTVQAFAWDVETNTRREVTFQVPHIRYTRSGSKRLEDPRDIYETVANQGARRLRACILAVIPGDVTEAAVHQCEQTMKANADTSPDAIKKMVAAFEAFGITAQQIEARIQRRLDAIQPAQIISLKKIYASLRDEMSEPADWFEPVADAKPAPASKADAIKAKIAARHAPKPQAPKAAAPADPETGEIAQPDGGTPDWITAGHEAQAPGMTYAQVAEQITAATDTDALDAARDLIRTVASEQQQAELNALAAKQLAAINKETQA